MFIKVILVALLAVQLANTQLQKPTKPFILSLNKVNWFAAQQMCRMHGMTLATINSERERQSLVTLLTQNRSRIPTGSQFWLAGNNLANADQWVWLSSGRPVVNYAETDENSCLLVNVNGIQSHGECLEDSNYFVCENVC